MLFYTEIRYSMWSVRVSNEGESLFICMPITDNTLSADALSDTRLMKEITWAEQCQQAH